MPKCFRTKERERRHATQSQGSNGPDHARFAPLQTRLELRHLSRALELDDIDISYYPSVARLTSIVATGHMAAQALGLAEETVMGAPAYDYSYLGSLRCFHMPKYV